MLNLANTPFRSRLLTGSGKFASPEQMRDAITASESQIVTLALKRLNVKDTRQDPTLAYLQAMDITLLPNTSGAGNADEAVYAANLARELLGTSWLKLEIHPDQRYLLPDPIETLRAAEALVKEGFKVLPYCSADPVLCKRLEEVGCTAVMPLGAPIGSNLGLKTRDFLSIIVEQAAVPVIVDAGIGSPSDACAAMEMGVDGVLVNTAIATARQPIDMAVAFAKAVECGRQAYLAGTASRQHEAAASSPFTTFLDTLE